MNRKTIFRIAVLVLVILLLAGYVITKVSNKHNKDGEYWKVTDVIVLDIVGEEGSFLTDDERSVYSKKDVVIQEDSLKVFDLECADRITATSEFNINEFLSNYRVLVDEMTGSTKPLSKDNLNIDSESVMITETLCNNQVASFIKVNNENALLEYKNTFFILDLVR